MSQNRLHDYFNGCLYYIRQQPDLSALKWVNEMRTELGFCYKLGLISMVDAEAFNSVLNLWLRVSSVSTIAYEFKQPVSIPAPNSLPINRNEWLKSSCFLLDELSTLPI